MKQIDIFYKQLLEEIRSRQETNEDGDSEEQTFTAYYLDVLSGLGETENPSVAYEERSLPDRSKFRINGYSISDNYETVDIFITLYDPSPQIHELKKKEIEDAIKLITTFYKKARSSNLDNILADSSEIKMFADTITHYKELEDKLVRINAIVLSNGIYYGETPEPVSIGRNDKYTMYYRILDLNALYERIEHDHAPIEINIKKMGFKIPCLAINVGSDDYESYLAVFPGQFLYTIYGEYGSRLLEQNVRSFLQFSGKINKGIKETIQKTPHRFFAYNNGLSITADKLELDTKGQHIEKISNLQIVNGGQTTASIYYSAKQYKCDLENIYIQAKISVIKNESDFQTIVSSISQYSNTQNKVNNADFSANNPYLQAIEHLSRTIITPTSNNGHQTYWFYERVRGQYRTKRLKGSFTKGGKAQFEQKYPSKQLLTKELFALYVNSYCEVWEGKKLVISPCIVAKGKDKNFSFFINHSLPSSLKEVNEDFYEDCIAKCILYLEADKRYGSRQKGDAEPIGDLKKNAIPYTLGLLNLITENKLDLYKIWLNQKVSEELSDFIYDLMVQVNQFFIDSAPEGMTNYLEWGKKSECWEMFKKGLENGSFEYDLNRILDDLENPQSKRQRKSVQSDMEQVEMQENKGILESIPVSIWKKIYNWGKDSNLITPRQLDKIDEIIYDLKYKKVLKEKLVAPGIKIFNIVMNENYDLLLEVDEARQEESINWENRDNMLEVVDTIQITLPLVKEMVKFDNDRKILPRWKYKAMEDVALGISELTPRLIHGFRLNLRDLVRYGFVFNL